MSISVKRVYFPGVLVFQVSPWHKTDAALHICQPLRLCYLLLKPHILSLYVSTQGEDWSWTLITIMDVV